MQSLKFLPFFKAFFAALILIFHFNLYAQSFDYEGFLLDCSNDNVNTVSAFLKRGGNPNYASLTDGDTCLMKALREDSHKTSALLLARLDTQLSRKNRTGESALMLASLKGNVLAVRAMLERGAAVNQEGWTALHVAANCGIVESVVWLSKAMANKNLDPFSLKDNVSSNSEGRGMQFYEI